MIPRKNVNDLQLTPEQLKTYKILERKEQTLKEALIRCGVRGNAVQKIIDSTDLNRLPENETILDDQIKRAWSDFIY